VNEQRRPLLVAKHEVCTCGHCRCIHVGGFQACLRCGPGRKVFCVRYTWPGPGADLPEFHKPTQKYKPRPGSQDRQIP
jgi:hypothetical protein